MQCTWVCLVITFLIKNAVKGESQAPAGNIIVSGELLTTVEKQIDRSLLSSSLHGFCIGSEIR